MGAAHCLLVFSANFFQTRLDRFSTVAKRRLARIDDCRSKAALSAQLNAQEYNKKKLQSSCV